MLLSQWPHCSVIKTRARKAAEQRSERTRRRAGVFAPRWVCWKMNNYADEIWFGKRDVFAWGGELNAKNEKTITLTVAVTAPEWSGVLMFCDMNSPSSCMQAAALRFFNLFFCRSRHAFTLSCKNRGTAQGPSLALKAGIQFCHTRRLPKRSILRLVQAKPLGNFLRL